MNNKKIKIIALSFPLIGFIILFFLIFIIIIGIVIGESINEEQVNNMQFNSYVINNQIYAQRYKQLLNKYMISYGYVSLERLVFYLQITNNILDTSILSYEEWEKAYLENCDINEKQMIPIKRICNDLENKSLLSNYTVESGKNKDNIQIDALNLCNNDDKSVIESDNYNDFFLALPYTFPIKEKFSVTSIVFEYRDIDLDITTEEKEKADFHSGWDLAVPIGTNFYSICDGIISNITNTQNNDLPFNQSKNSTGNYMMVQCSDGLTAMYWHLQYKSQPEYLTIGSEVRKGELLGRTSTTGTSTGPHLHLGLKDSEGNLLDAMAYIDFNSYEGS